jgi:hypothetical protein
MAQEEAKNFNIPEEERRDYVRLDRGKLNIARRTGPATWFKLCSVNLGNCNETYPNGDDVQTAELWTPPQAWVGLDNALLNRILDAIDAGLCDETGKPTGERYTDANAAVTRAVWKVVQKFAPQKTEGQCRAVIRQWVKNGVPEAKDYYSEADRKDRSGLHVNNPKRPGKEIPIV